MLLDELRDEIELRLGLGKSLSEVQAELIDPVPLDEDAKAALWLFAWCCASKEGGRNAADHRGGNWD